MEMTQQLTFIYVTRAIRASKKYPKHQSIVTDIIKCEITRRFESQVQPYKWINFDCVQKEK